MKLESIAHNLVPRPLRKALRDRILRRRLAIRPLRVVSGAGNIFADGWVPTESDQLDLLDPGVLDEIRRCRCDRRAAGGACLGASDVQRGKDGRGHLSSIFAGRGLYPGRSARRLLSRRRLSGVHQGRGRRRRRVGPGASGRLYVPVAERGVESAGFSIRLLEYHDEAGAFHGRDWNPLDGKILRSRRFDSRGPISVILDAIK